MMSFLYSVVGFIIAIAVLVTVHEFGHYWVAKRLGVKVLRFSVGFGKPIWKRVAGKDQTEYVIAAIPLGGYVKMLGEGDDDFSKHEAHRAFDNQKLWKRALIVFAGPAINFLFAILVYAGLNMYGFQTLQPVIGALPEDSILYQAGIREGDKIISVDSRPSEYFGQHNLHIFNAALGRNQMNLEIHREGENSLVEVDFSELRVRNFKPSFLEYEIGLTPVMPTALPIVDKLENNFPAEEAGIEKGDRIVRINDAETSSWQEVVDAIRSANDGLMDVMVLRGDDYKVLSLRPRVIEKDGAFINQIGIYPVVEPIGDQLRFYYQYSVSQAFVEASARTWEMSVLTLRMLWKMIIGQASYKNISGPVAIASFTGEALQISWEYYLTILAVVSISLAVMNLLPVPMLDGGHLMYYAFEAVKGRPLSDKAMLIGQKIGLLLLAGLMSLAFYNDIFRLLS